MDNTPFTEHTARLVDVNENRLQERRRADTYEDKYKSLVGSIRTDYKDDYITEKAKVSDNLYELARFRYNANFYAMLRNCFLGLIILALLLRMRLLSPFVSYILGALIAVGMCVYWWITMAYQDTRRSGVVFNEYVPSRAMAQPSSAGKSQCQ